MPTYIKFVFIIPLFFIFFLAGHTVYAYYDLEVETPTISPAEPAVNEPVVVTIKVKNKGSSWMNDNTGANQTRVNFQDFNHTRTIMAPVDISVSPVESDKYITYKVEGYFFSLGKKNVGFGVNEIGVLEEINSLNNYNYIENKVKIVEPYDLKMESIVSVPLSPAANQDCIITVKVKNNGFAMLRTGEGVNTISYNFPGFTLTDSTYPTIDSQHHIYTNEFFYYTFAGKFTSEGVKTMSFSIDTNNHLAEKDEGNNTINTDITILSPHSVDIAVDSIVLDPVEPVINEDVEITVTIKNTGSVSLISAKGLLQEKDITIFPIINKDVREEFMDFSETENDHSDYPSLDDPFDANKDKLTYTYSGKFTSAGEKELTFEININNRLGEQSRANNTFSTATKIYATAKERDDFSISNVLMEFMDSTAAVISWTTSKKAASRAMYKRNAFTGFLDTGETTDTEHSREIYELAANNKHDYKISATYGTVTKNLENQVFFTPANSFFQITSGPTVVITDNAATINWTTDMLASSTFYYKKADSADYTSVISGASAVNHAVELASLTPGSYEYYLVLTNRPGFIVESSKYNFTIGEPVAEDDAANTDESSTAEDSDSPGDTPAVSVATTQAITNTSLYNNLKGKIILKVEAAGEAYYVHPGTERMHYLGRPNDAFAVMREQGVGIINANLSRIPIGLSGLSGADTDGDGLPDIFEDAIGSSKNNVDSDSDGYLDYGEIVQGYNPGGAGNWSIDKNFASAQVGKIFLQVEGNGEAWYINPADEKRYFLGRPADAFNIMRTLGLGISNVNFDSL